MKLHLMKCQILPIVLYGCETWTLNQSAKNKLQSFEMKCLRKVLNIKWFDQITNSEIADRTNIPIDNIIYQIHNIQIHWLGTVLHMEDQHLAKSSLQAHQLDKCCRGHPCTLWFNSLPLQGISLTQASNLGPQPEWLEISI